jgi:predicted amidophosphoribosyltransferase
VGLLLPTKCLVCAQPPHPCCPDCRPTPSVRVFKRFEPSLETHQQGQHAQLSGFSGGAYSAELSKLLGAYKDSGQLWLLGDLVPLARAALTQAVSSVMPAAAAQLPAAPLATASDPAPIPAEALPKIDFATYIGSSRSNYRKRGYNPALSLLRVANRETRLPILRALAPNPEVRDQSNLTAADRAANLANALLPARSRFAKPQRALLFDDVVTTGSTLAAARAVLTAINVEVVAIAVLADVDLRHQVSRA